MKLRSWMSFFLRNRRWRWLIWSCCSHRNRSRCSNNNTTTSKMAMSIRRSVTRNMTTSSWTSLTHFRKIRGWTCQVDKLPDLRRHCITGVGGSVTLGLDRIISHVNRVSTGVYVYVQICQEMIFNGSSRYDRCRIILQKCKKAECKFIAGHSPGEPLLARQRRSCLQEGWG